MPVITELDISQIIGGQTSEVTATKLDKVPAKKIGVEFAMAHVIGDVSLADRAEATLLHLAQVMTGDRRVLVLGGGDRIIQKRYGEQLVAAGIDFVYDPDEISGEDPAAAIVANIGSESGVEEVIQNLRDRVQTEGDVFINIHKGPNQNGSFESGEKIDEIFEEAGFQLRSTEQKRSKEGNVWFEVDAVRLSDEQPSRGIRRYEPREPRDFADMYR